MTVAEPSHIPLHLHSEYSLLDGASRIDDICSKAKETGMPGIAITDHGVMYGVYNFVKSAQKNEIKPIIGCELYVVNLDHTERSRSKLYHLVLLAKNDNGYRNLCKLSSEGCINGFYYKPRVSIEYLKQHSDDLIALSACLGGEVNNLLLNGKEQEAKDAASKYKDIFGEDFYLEIQDHKYPEDRVVNPKVVSLAKELGIKVIATNDSHYTNKEDAIAHDALLCLQTQKYISDFPRMHFSSHEYIKTGPEMLELFQDHLSPDVISEAVLDTSTEIFNKVEGYKTFEEEVMHMPHVDLPEGHSYETYLKEISYEGAKERFGEITDDVRDRLEIELKIMNDSGFASYFIVVWDFIKWAKEHKIPVGPGRGSAAGSLVAYCLKITNIDPLKYDLLFERFLNPERKSMPDIDTDFCIDRREEVINYVREKYGEDCVCQIITFNKLTSRAVIKDMARVLEYPYAKAEELAKMIPVVRGKPRAISWMIENHSEFGAKYKNDPAAKQVIDLAMKNEGTNKTFGVHAAGVIIADQALTNLIPTSKSKEGGIITQFAMEEAAGMGLLKMDFLGLRNLTMIQKAVDLINIEKQKNLKEGEEFKAFDIEDISLEDKETFETVSSGNLAGIFQLETSGGMKKVARDLAPENLEDISALIALYRPGPLDTGMIDDFINRKSGKEKIKYEHPMLETILRNTYGTIVYQEQIMQIAQVLANFSLGEADLLRRAMGKKKPEVLLPFKKKFTDGCDKNEIPGDVSEKLFEQMLSFAEYCFNKSHSTAYGMVTYQTAYLKTHFPVEYLTSLFIATNGDTDKIKFYINEAERLEIKVVPPNINLSDLDFKNDSDAKKIIFGMGAIKGVGEPPAKEIIRAREEDGPFKDFYDFCKRVDHKIVNKKTLESLIKCGAMDCLGAGRKAMLENMESFADSAKRKKEEEAKGQVNLFAAMADSGSDSEAAGSFDLTPNFINGQDDEYPERELQAMEYGLLGLYVNNHPMASMKNLSSAIARHKISKLAEMADSSKVNFTALVTDVIKKLTKTNKLICICKLEDTESKVEGVVFSSKLESLERFLEEGKRLLVSGTLSTRSEGDYSVLIDDIQDLENMNLIEYDVDISQINDFFQFFHTIKNFTSQEQNRGQDILVLNLEDGEESQKLSLGRNFSVLDSEHVRKNIQDIIAKFSQTKATAA